MADAIEVRGLSKHYGGITAVQDLSFAVRPGAVTGFLGPDGAGKTTTLRVLLGLARATRGEALIEGRPYRELDDPVRVVGAALETTGFHPGRGGRDHLRALCAMAGLPARRADAVLGQVDLAGRTGRRRVGGWSPGMRQRLAVAGALLGDPRILVLDEPLDGLDPAGVDWLHDLLRRLADEGRTVLVSSHVLAEVAQLADDVVVIARGRLVDQGPVARLTGGEGTSVVVQAALLDELAAALRAAGASVDPHDDGLRVRGLGAPIVGEVALRCGIPLHALYEERQTLEQIFSALTEPQEVEP